MRENEVDSSSDFNGSFAKVLHETKKDNNCS